MPKYDWEVFICHASEDKAAVARPLANHLAALGLKVWLDESEIRLGDSLRSKIDAGLTRSRFGVVILSPNFFSKNWAKSELDGLIAREVNGAKVVLPIWHSVTYDDVRRQSPILAGRLGADTDKGLANTAKAILAAIEDEGPIDRPATPIFAGRLTKKLFLEFPEGCFLLGNAYKSDLTPKFAEPIPQFAKRENFWKVLSEEGVIKTKCYVFSDAAAYRAHMASRNIYRPKTSEIRRNRHASDLPYDFDLEIVRALVAAGKSPPPAWRPFIRTLSFEDERYKFNNLEGLKTLDHLERLDLFDIEPKNLDALAGLTNLRWLYLSNSPSDNLRSLSNLKNLEYLDINMDRVTDIGPLASLKQLKHLNLFCKNVSDVTALGQLKNLEFLNLSMTRVGNASPLRSLKELRILVLMATPVEDASALSNLSNLQSLCLWKTHVADLSPLASLKELRTLDIDETPIKKVAALSGLNKLRFLSAANTDIQDLSALRHIPDLEILLGNGPYNGAATIDLNEKWQVWYWTRQLGVDEGRLRSLIERHGNFAVVVGRALRDE